MMLEVAGSVATKVAAVMTIDGRISTGQKAIEASYNRVIAESAGCP